ncbi:transpeptidase family protein [Flavobacteriales bacterium]|nr:transpeptidase family protein [Flavobacteriales bacterium]
MNHSKNIKRRAVAIYLFMILLALVIILQPLYTQIFESHLWNTDKYNVTRTVSVPASRGNIYSDDLSLLATSIPEYEIRWDAKQVDKESFLAEVEELATLLSNLFEDKSPNEYSTFLRKIWNKQSRYALIKRKVNYNELKILKQLPIFREGRYKGGFQYKQLNIRQKPFQSLAARTIGYHKQQSKSVGIEGAFNYDLKGKDGERLEQRLAGNEWMPIRERESFPGKDVITTIDIRFQDIAHKALEDRLYYHDAEFGTTILMEVATGEIKSIVNLKKVDEDRYNEFYNFAIGRSIEPGSTFKLASVIAGLEDGYLQLDDSVNTTGGEHNFYDRVMRDSKRGGYGVISLEKSFIKSSNVGISKLINKHYKSKPSQFVDRLYSMGLNEPLNIALSGEVKPEIRHPKQSANWSGITLPWMSIGYGIMMTPLQILSFYAAIANDGQRMKPMFVKSIMFNGITEKSFSPEVLNPSICSMTTIHKVKTMLEDVVEIGTAQDIKSKQYKIAGKTGTAQLIIDGSHNNQRHLASFVGYFPADKPKYACIVMINDPQENGSYGGDVAAPVFRTIADYVINTDFSLHHADSVENRQMPVSKDGNKKHLATVFNSFNVPITSDNDRAEWVLTKSKKDKVELQTRNIIKDLEKNKMPNIKGMGLNDVLFLLENYGLKINYSGRGSVEEQSITKGENIRKGQNLSIVLS